MSSELTLETHVAGEDAFAVTSTIVSGERAAVVVDAQFTRTEARRLAERIRALGKDLAAVYVTHGHPDHYWGLGVLREAFPNASFLTAPEVLTEIEATVEGKVAQWKPVYGDEVPDAPVLPEAIDGEVIDLEGHALEVLHVGQGDDPDSTAISIPDLGALIAGDVAFDGTHVWLAETDAEARRAWVGNLEKLAASDPRIVVPGHQASAGADHDPERVLLGQTRDYIEAFDAEVAAAGSRQELLEAMGRRFGDRALPMVLELSAQAAFPSEPAG